MQAEPIIRMVNVLHNCPLMLLQNNAFDSPLPTSLGSLSGLEYLNLAHSAFTGPPPSSWANLGSLRYLNMTGSPVGAAGQVGPPTYSLPMEWMGGGGIQGSVGGMASLEVLSCRKCRLAGNLSWLDQAGALPWLQVLELDRNALQGPLPQGEIMDGTMAMLNQVSQPCLINAAVSFMYLRRDFKACSSSQRTCCTL